MEIAYYELTESDIPQIARLETEFFSQPWKEESISHYLENGNLIFIVAKDPKAADGEDVAGYMALLQLVDESDLVSIGVHKDYRRMGIAREMMDIAYEMAQECGIAKIHLEVRESNVSAIALYESEGFERVGVRKGYYDKPKEDALLYTKQLR